LIAIKIAEKIIANGIYKKKLNHKFTFSFPLKINYKKINIGRNIFIGK
jgi:hypothetical protein